MQLELPFSSDGRTKWHFDEAKNKKKKMYISREQNNVVNGII